MSALDVDCAVAPPSKDNRIMQVYARKQGIQVMETILALVYYTEIKVYFGKRLDYQGRAGMLHVFLALGDVRQNRLFYIQAGKIILLQELRGFPGLAETVPDA